MATLEELQKRIQRLEDIKQVEKRIKQATPKLQLDGPEAQGLVGEE